MSYNRQPVAEDPMQIWGRCWCPSYPAAIRYMVILAGSGLRQLPDSSYLMGTG